MRFLSMKEGAARLGWSESKAWAASSDDPKLRDPDFPRRVHLGPRMTRLVERELTIYQIKLLARRDNIPANQLDGYIAEKLSQEAAL